MVRALVILTLSISTYCSGQVPSVIKSDHVRIDHSGPIDKPIIPLVITTEDLDLPRTELPIQVNRNIFSIVTRYIEDSEALEPKKRLNEFGVFKVTKYIDGHSKLHPTA